MSLLDADLIGQMVGYECYRLLIGQVMEYNAVSAHCGAGWIKQMAEYAVAA